MTSRRTVLAAGCLLAAVSAGRIAAQTRTLTVVASQRVISITPRYAGDPVRVHGTAPDSDAIVLALTSPRETLACSQKGRVGPFWLSVRTVRIRNVPRMYKVESTAPLDTILTPAEQVRYGLGRAGLKASMSVDQGLSRDLYLDELILIRERDRRFGFHEQGVHREGDRYDATFFWPPDAPTGRYRIEAYAVRGGRVVATAETSVDVRAVGVEAWIRELAADHGTLYGLFAVALAAAAGLLVCLLFGGLRKPVRPRAARSGEVNGRPAA